MRIPLLSLAAAAALALVGCGHEISTPSLAPRAVEKQPIEMPATDTHEVETPVDAALVAQIAPLVAAAESADKTFTAQRIRTETVIARAAGAAQGSDAWIAAQVALTALDAARGPIRETAGAIDALRLDPANAAHGNRVAIDEAAARIAAIETAEGTAIALLAARLG